MPKKLRWQELQLPPPGNRMQIPAGRYQIHIEIPEMWKRQAKRLIESWGYKLHSMKAHPTWRGVYVADVTLPHADAVTVTSWTRAAFQQIPE
jgi:hypothetical protein